MSLSEPSEFSTDNPIHEAVMDAIVSQRLAPSQKVSENILTEMFDITRSAARNLIEYLTAQQFLVSVSPRVTRVAPLTLLDVKQNFALRKMLVPDICAMAARHVDYDELIGANRVLTEAGVISDDESALRILKANKQFNIAIAEKTDYPLLIDWARQLEDMAMRIYWLYVKRHQALPFGPDQHDMIIEALRKDDTGRIKALVQDTLEQNEERVLNAIFADQKFYTQDLQV